MEESKKRRLEEGGGNGEFQSSAAKKTLKQLASLLTTDELQQLIADAASAHGDVASSLFAATSKSNQNRKVFVRGLDFDTSSETLNQIFSQYGKVEDCSVIRDKATGKSRGFGFITFAEMYAIVRALEEPSKLVDGRMAVCQLAVLGSRNNPQQQQQQQQHQQQQVQQGQYTDDILERKIFVANVHSSIPSETLLSYFAQYGDIQEGPIGFDKLTKKSRGYAIFVYKTVAGARSALAEPNKTIDGHQVFVKLAGDPKGKHAAQQQQQQQQQQAQAGQLYQQQLYAQQQIMQPVVQGLAQVQQDGQTQQVYYSTGYTVAQPATAYTATPGAVPGTQTLAPSQQAALYAYQTAAPVSTNGGYTVAASAVQQPYGVTQATMASPMVGTLQPQALYGVAAAPQTAAGQAAGIYYSAATPQQQTAVSSVLSSSQALRSAGQGAVVLPAGYQAAPQQVGAAGAPGSYYATAAGAQPYGASAAGAVSLAYGSHGMGASAPRAP